MKRIVITVPRKRFERFKVFFPDDWDIVYMEAPYSQEQLIHACRKSEYLFVGSIHPVEASVFESCPQLKMVHVEGVGFDKVDIVAAAEKQVPVCNNRAVNNGAVAEHTIGLILAALRRTALCNEQIYKIGYAACKAQHLSDGQHELAEKTLGLIGIGAIGREVAKRLRSWGCTIIYHDIFKLSEEEEKQLEVKHVDIDEIFLASDIISLHVPVVESTYHLVNKLRLLSMKRSAILINTARGEIIDQEALVDALEQGLIACAALDTLDPEPPPSDHVLLNLSEVAKDRLILTPHIGGMTDEAFTRMLRNAIRNFERVEEGEEPVNIVNRLETVKGLAEHHR